MTETYLFGVHGITFIKRYRMQTPKIKI